MKTITIAFDVDGTLRSALTESEVLAREDIRTLLRLLHSMRNVRIVLWSGSGEMYARQVARELHLMPYIDGVIAKGSIHPDITIDDEESMALGTFNLIVAEERNAP